ncbi:MAG: transcription initiation factor IIB [Candidatus Helarchaeota archaeon]
MTDKSDEVETDQENEENEWDCCDNPNVQEYRGLYVCTNCGIVHGQVFEDAPRRAFTAEEIQDRRQTEPVYGTGGSRTVIPRFERDVSAKKKQKYYRLAKIQRSTTSTFERNMSIAQPKLLGFAAALGLPRSITEEALRIYREVVNKRLTMGRSINNLVAGSIYAAIRKNDLPRTVEEISMVTQIPEKSITKAYRLIVSNLNLLLTSTSIPQFINRFGEDLQISMPIQIEANNLISKARENGLQTIGKDPKGLAAAALYIAAKDGGEPKSQSLIAKICGVSEVTLRNRAKEIKKYLDMKN